MSQIPLHSIEDLREAVSGADLEARQLGAGPVTGRLWHAELGDLTLTIGDVRGTVELRGALSQHRIALGVLLSAGASQRQWLREIEVGDVGIFPNAKEHHAIYRSHALYAALTVDTEGIMRRLGSEGLAFDERLLRQPGMLGSGPQACAASRRIAMAIERDAGALKDPTVRREFAARMLLAYGADLAAHSRGELSPPPRLPTPARIVRDAGRFIDAHPDRPVTVEEICVRFGVARRSLHRAFIEVLGMPPASYMRLARLNGVRRDLVRRRGDPTATVTAIASDWGFGEFGRFAAQYRRIFGELPSTTLVKR